MKLLGARLSLHTALQPSQAAKFPKADAPVEQRNKKLPKQSKGSLKKAILSQTGSM